MPWYDDDDDDDEDDDDRLARMQTYPLHVTYVHASCHNCNKIII